VVVLPGAGHGNSDCLVPLVAGFIRNPSASAPLPACAALPMRMEFVGSASPVIHH